VNYEHKYKILIRVTAIIRAYMRELEMGMGDEGQRRSEACIRDAGPGHGVASGDSSALHYHAVGQARRLPLVFIPSY
jgi:hypothetical protein